MISVCQVDSNKCERIRTTQQARDRKANRPPNTTIGLRLNEYIYPKYMRTYVAPVFRGFSSAVLPDLHRWCRRIGGIRSR